MVCNGLDGMGWMGDGMKWFEKVEDVMGWYMMLGDGMRWNQMEEDDMVWYGMV